MFVFDAVIYNEDRHFGNFGLLRDNHTGKLIAPAPIFDNGLSLFAHSMPSDWQDMPTYAATRSNPYEISYDALCRKVMGAEQRKQLAAADRLPVHPAPDHQLAGGTPAGHRAAARPPGGETFTHNG